MKRWGQALIAAFQFLTRLPIPVQVPYEEEVISRSIVFYPLAGAVIGGLVYAGARLLPAAAAPLNAAILLAFWTALTGGLHLDGWMDTADGLGSQRSRERMLAIMKDSRVGAMGVLAAVLLLLVKWAALWILAAHAGPYALGYALILVPAASRWWMATAITVWPYIGGPNGLGGMFRRFGWGPWIAATLLALVPAAFAPKAGWLLLPAIQLAAGWPAGRHCLRRLGGMTGDTYGALQEWVETAGLAAAAYLSVFRS